MIELKKPLQRFIETYIELIENESIIELYDLLESQLPDPASISQFTQALYGCGITVSNYFKHLPPWYRFNDQNLYTEIIPDNILGIGSNAYDNCSNLTSIHLGKIEVIASYAFMNSGLEKVIIPETCKHISLGAFQNCKDLTEVILSEGLEQISSRAFSFTDIPELRLPRSITFLGNNIFNKNTKLILPSDNVAISRYLTASKHENYEYYG